MNPKNQALECKNGTLRGDGFSKIVQNRRTSLMDDPLSNGIYSDIRLVGIFECFYARTTLLL